MKTFTILCCCAAFYYLFFIMPDEYKKERALKSQFTSRPTLPQVTAGHTTATLPALWAAIRQEQRQEDFAQVKIDIDLLISNYPESEQARAVAHLAGRYDSLARLAQQREAIKAQRRHQPGYYNEYPMESYNYWTIQHRVDEFSDTLPASYLTTTQFVYFYGSVTSYGYNSPLRARIEVDSAQAIAFTLFKATSSSHVNERGKSIYQADELSPLQTTYAVAARNDNGRTCRLTALASQNRLQLNAADSYTLHQLLQHGGQIRFVFTQADDASTVYRFSISNADDYEAYCHELLIRAGAQRLSAPTR